MRQRCAWGAHTWAPCRSATSRYAPNSCWGLGRRRHPGGARRSIAVPRQAAREAEKQVRQGAQQASRITSASATSGRSTGPKHQALVEGEAPAEPARDRTHPQDRSLSLRREKRGCSNRSRSARVVASSAATSTKSVTLSLIRRLSCGKMRLRLCVERDGKTSVAAYWSTLTHVPSHTRIRTHSRFPSMPCYASSWINSRWHQHANG